MRTLLLITTTLLASTGAALAAPDCPSLPATAEDMQSLDIYIEYNATDEDLGVHGGFGQSGWTAACIYDAAGTLMVSAGPGGTFAETGMADLFFEGREPPISEWSYDALRAGFPEGTYRVELMTVDGTGAYATTEFTTIVPTMPVITSAGFVDDEETAAQAPAQTGDIAVTWDAVTTSIDGRPVTIVGYQVILTPVEDTDAAGRLTPRVDVIVGADTLRFDVASGILAPEMVYEVEVLAVADDHNQTIGIMWFRTE